MASYFPRDVRFVPLLRSALTGCAESSGFVIMFLGATGLTSIVAFCPAHHCLSLVVRDSTMHGEATEWAYREGMGASQGGRL